MRRRFTRGRRRNGASDAEPIDATRWLPRILERGVVDATSLEPIELPGIPSHFVVLGSGQDAVGKPVIVAFSPTRGADAALAALAVGARRQVEDEPEASLYAVAPDWSAADRRRLALLAPRIDYAAVAASGVAESGVRVAAEPPEAASCEPALVAGLLARADERALFDRALTALGGLAAKHGGAMRGVSDRVELVVMARRTASLMAETGRMRIEVHEPERATLALDSGESLATALDRLEGLLRKLLNDRRLRTSEAGIRTALAPVLERAAEVGPSARWPRVRGEGAPLDWVAFDANGRVICGAIRETLSLPALAEILDAVVDSAPVARELARRAGRPAQAGRPGLALAATEFEPGVLEACAASGVGLQVFEAATRRNGDWALEAKTLPELRAGSGLVAATVAPVSDVSEPDRASGADRAADSAEASDEEPRPRRSRRRGRRSGGSGAAAKESRAAGESKGDGSAPSAAGFEEVSLFDLDEDAPASESSSEGEGQSRRGRRPRRRGRRGRSREGRSEEGASSEEGDGASNHGRRRRSGGGVRRSAAADSDDADEDDPLLDDDAIAPLAADAPELEEEDTDSGSYEDEDDDGEADPEADRTRRERERRRRERAAKPPEPPPAPRRRAAFLVHADPISVLTATVLARDVRLVESFRIYPQDDLMTFFRSVATDLKEGTPIFLVGFAASQPARDTFQAAALYAGRLDWFDHHEWPPEDLETLRATIGADHVHVVPGAECSLASVIAARTRRSRFSDKLVELITGRFSQHDYERWGRWWWHRAGEIAKNPGERRPDIDALLAGRPSDLARAVAKEPEPPLPPELTFVSERDFRLVHFGGYSMVVVEVPDGLDLHLTARIARERYDAQISLATRPAKDLVVLGGDDTRVKRGLDLGGMTAHLASKHAWVEALPDDDHVARMHVRRLHDESGRFDELITEIAMGRSIVEG